MSMRVLELDISSFRYAAICQTYDVCYNVFIDTFYRSICMYVYGHLLIHTITWPYQFRFVSRTSSRRLVRVVEQQQWDGPTESAGRPHEEKPIEPISIEGSMTQQAFFFAPCRKHERGLEEGRLFLSDRAVDVETRTRNISWGSWNSSRDQLWLQSLSGFFLWYNESSMR